MNALVDASRTGPDKVTLIGYTVSAAWRAAINDKQIYVGDFPASASFFFFKDDETPLPFFTQPQGDCNTRYRVTANSSNQSIEAIGYSVPSLLGLLTADGALVGERGHDYFVPLVLAPSVREGAVDEYYTIGTDSTNTLLVAVELVIESIQ